MMPGGPQRPHRGPEPSTLPSRRWDAEPQNQTPLSLAAGAPRTVPPRDDYGVRSLRTSGALLGCPSPSLSASPLPFPPPPTLPPSRTRNYCYLLLSANLLPSISRPRPAQGGPSPDATTTWWPWPQPTIARRPLLPNQREKIHPTVDARPHSFIRVGSAPPMTTTGYGNVLRRAFHRSTGSTGGISRRLVGAATPLKLPI